MNLLSPITRERERQREFQLLLLVKSIAVMSFTRIPRNFVTHIFTYAPEHVLLRISFPPPSTRRMCELQFTMCVRVPPPFYRCTLQFICGNIMLAYRKRATVTVHIALQHTHSHNCIIFHKNARVLCERRDEKYNATTTT